MIDELSDALTKALADNRPGCADDWRYIQDKETIDGADLIVMKAICRACPVSRLCTDYADAARPEAGMWAGKYYPKRQINRTAARPVIVL